MCANISAENLALCVVGFEPKNPFLVGALTTVQGLCLQLFQKFPDRGQHLSSVTR
jgi:hypothetical protein